VDLGLVAERRRGGSDLILRGFGRVEMRRSELRDSIDVDLSRSYAESEGVGVPVRMRKEKES